MTKTSITGLAEQVRTLEVRVRRLEDRWPLAAGPFKPDPTPAKLPDVDHPDFYRDLLDAMKARFGRYCYDIWFAHTRLVRDDGHELTISTIDGLQELWLRQTYTFAVEEALAQIGRPGVKVTFVSRSALPDSTGASGDGAQDGKSCVL